MYRSIRPIAAWLAILLASLVVPRVAIAQPAVASATVTGTVLDPSDAVIAGATVSLRNHDTNHVIETTTDGRGRYRLLYVPGGEYHLSVAASGFAVANVNLTLTVGQAIDVPVKVMIPVTVEETTVVHDAPAVETRRAKKCVPLAL